MARFKKLVFTAKTKAGFHVEIIADCRRYWHPKKRWCVTEYNIFEKCLVKQNISVDEVRKLVKGFYAKYE